ncbi:hypothetical protein Dxin01_00180 [Deinococcus xinjiangensis]|uniref:Uncharacterized protein n=1 Tax=Deinococcus xinjiangensis TaxID=457454 RepID=A0ABP9V5H2_9DEIO
MARGTDVYLAIKPQVDLQTPVPDTTLVTGDYLGFDSEAMGGSRQSVQARTIKRSSVRKSASSANGTIAAGGTVDFTGTQLVLDKLLPLATHTSSTVQWFKSNGSGGETVASGPNDAGAYPKVTMTPVDAATVGEKAAGVHRNTYTLLDGGKLTPFTLFIGMMGGEGAEGNYTRKFTGCKINTISFGMRVNDFLKITTDIQGVEKTLPDGTRTPTYPLDEVEYSYFFDGASAHIKAGNMADLVEIPVSATDLELNHNLNTEDYRLHAIKRQSLDEGITDVSGSFEMTAGARGIDGTLNAVSQLQNDRAFLERLNLEAKAASLEYRYIDWTRPIVEGALATGSTRTVLKLAEAPLSLRPGDEVFYGSGDTTNQDSTAKYRVAAVDVAAKTVTLAGAGLSSDPVEGTEIRIPSMLRIKLPYIRLEEPDFHARDTSTIRGTARFSGFSGVTIEHIYKI